MAKLIEVDLSVTIEVDLVDQLCPNAILFLSHLLLATETRERRFDLLGVDSATTILVKQSKCHF